MKNTFVTMAAALMGTAAAQHYSNSSMPSNSTMPSTSSSVDLSSSMASSTGSMGSGSGSSSMGSGSMPSSVTGTMVSTTPMVTSSESSGTATQTSSSAAPTYTNGAQPVVQGPDGPVAFKVQTDVTYAGTPLNLMKRGLGKRARASNLNECLDTCAQSSACVGTSYTDSTSECSFFSGISGQPMSAPGTDFAQVTSRNGVPVDAGAASNGTSSMVSMSRSAGFSSTLYGNSSTMASMSKTSSVQVSGSATGSAGSVSRSATGSVSRSATGSATRASGSGSSAAASATSTPSLITFDGILFKLEIDISYTGITFDIEIDLAKRAGQTLDDCLGACAGNSSCVGTAYNANTTSCTYYSSINSNSRMSAPGITFATVESRIGNSTTTGTGSPSSNSTASSTSSSASATATSLEDLICPKLNGDVITTPLDVDFVIECGQGVAGDVLTIEASRKRQATTLPTSLSNCVDICATEAACVATTFDRNTNTCTYFSTFDLIVAETFDTALRLENNGAAVTTVTQGGSAATITNMPTGGNGGAMSTATIYSPTVVTIYSCAPTVTDCPLRAGQNAATVTTVIPVAETVYQCPYTTNANLVTALAGAVTEQDIVTSTVYECPAGQTITVSGTQMVPAQATTITETYTTHITQSSSAATPVMTGDNASKSVVYVQQVVSVCPTTTLTQYVVVSTAPPAPAQATATVTATQGCNGVNCPAVSTTVKITINTVIPQQSAPAQCNGVNCPASMSGASGMTTSAYATASASQPLAYTGAGSVVSVQGGVVALAAAVFSIFMF
ncbi:hypothetical protein QM012_009430 [Aureobasidium pullulans]|uniref:Apple domain-containing protein n=1 Tax=Aureobasidium pullulans TaxID=5580 RepID=A0ABR0TGU9_AURPU